MLKEKITKEFLNTIFYYKDGELYKKKDNTKVGWVDHGYKRVSIKNKKYYVHRIIWIMFNKDVPNTIDHVNQNKLDNRIENLRNVTEFENSKNTKLRSTNNSGKMGVYFEKNYKKWNAFIFYNYKKINLGYFTDKNEAIKEREKAEMKYGYHKNHGAFMDYKNV